MSACGGGDGGGDRGDPLDPSGSTTAPAAARPLVVLVRYGGLAGTNDRVSVDTAGHVTLISDRSPTPATHVLPPDELATLRTALERSEIATLERNYLDPRAADAYQYDVTYQGLTVTADEGVLPPSLRPVVDQLTPLIRA